MDQSGILHHWTDVTIHFIAFTQQVIMIRRTFELSKRSKILLTNSKLYFQTFKVHVHVFVFFHRVCLSLLQDLKIYILPHMLKYFTDVVVFFVLPPPTRTCSVHKWLTELLSRRRVHQVVCDWSERCGHVYMEKRQSHWGAADQGC